MDKICAFCGKSLKASDREFLVCGGISQPVCRECRTKHLNTPNEERVERLLRFGWPEQPEKLKQFLEDRKKQAQAARTARATGLTCLRCGGEMLRYQHVRLAQYETAALSSYAVGQLEMDVLRCETCGRAEFYLPNPPLDLEMPVEMVTCPVCGKEHPAGTNCPRCAVNSALDRRRPVKKARAEGSESKDRKPPWEK